MIADQENRESEVANVDHATTEFDVKKRTLLERDNFSISELKVAQLDSTLIIAQFSQDQYIAEVVGIEPKYSSGISTLAAVEKLKAEFVIGSGYVVSFVPPVPAGLLVVNNATLSTVNEEGFSTLVAVVKGKVNLLPKEQWADESISGAFQVGPRLVEDGAAVILDLKKGSATRAFVGLREDNSVVAGVTLGDVNLQLLADFLAAPADSGGLATVDAVNLAGGGSEAFLYSNNNDQFAYGNVKSRQASMLAFRRKPESVAKRGIAAAVAARAGIGQEESAVCVDALLVAIADNLSAGRSVNVAEFGTFSVTERTARSGRNPRTGEAIKIEASKVPGFKPSRSLTDRVNAGLGTADERQSSDVGRTDRVARAIVQVEPELAAEIASGSGLAVTTTRKCTSAFFEEVGDVLAKGSSVPLVGLGTFSVRNRAARMGRNPKTGEAVFISASSVVSFKAGKTLKDAVN
jgi:DNA-binding protein HU-beta